MKAWITAAAAALLAAQASAQDFSAGSEAKKWNVFGVEKARFVATAVDAVCVLTGDCPEDCGDGKRQMVLVREADGRMVLAAKNAQPVFSGAAADLAPYCNQRIEVDGLLVGDPEITPGLGAKLYQVQTIRRIGSDAAQPAKRFTKVWAEHFPEAEGDGPWFRRDPRIQAEIAEDGYLGLGPEVDRQFIEESY